MKRLIDLVGSLLLLLPFLPFGLVICAILRLTGEGKVFYLQPRVGQHGRVIQLIKYVTMLEDSPNLGSGDITLKNDPRVLPVGRFLRKAKLNEVPQLLNVLKGDMSLVGPRPLTAKTFQHYAEDVQAEIKKVKPGLTGIGSIVFRDEERILNESSKSYLECYREDIAPYKGRLELWYIQNRSLLVDVKILLLTAWVVFFPESKLYFRFFGELPQRA
jgi:lipopolysaccharide/colanic/teichoic acid biosynthesis glycosyltransferase